MYAFESNSFSPKQKKHSSWFSTEMNSTEKSVTPICLKRCKDSGKCKKILFPYFYNHSLLLEIALKFGQWNVHCALLEIFLQVGRAIRIVLWMRNVLPSLWHLNFVFGMSYDLMCSFSNCHDFTLLACFQHGLLLLWHNKIFFSLCFLVNGVLSEQQRSN